jgi:hypothetical protein
MFSEFAREHIECARDESFRIRTFFDQLPNQGCYYRFSLNRVRRYWLEYQESGQTHAYGRLRWDERRVRVIMWQNFRTFSWLQDVIRVPQKEPTISGETQAEAVDSAEKNEAVFWSSFLNLTHGACVDFLTPFKWLSSEVMDAAQKLIAFQFPELDVIGGMQSTKSQGEKYVFRRCWKKSLQILGNMPVKQRMVDHLKNKTPQTELGNHWVLVTSPAWHDGRVFLYDSMNAKTIDPAVQHDLKLLYGDAPVHIVPVPDQNDFSSCGLFAIATAFCLCLGMEDIPAFDKPQMRAHLLHCFKEKKVICFPVLHAQDKNSNGGAGHSPDSGL